MIEWNLNDDSSDGTRQRRTCTDNDIREWHMYALCLNSTLTKYENGSDVDSLNAAALSKLDLFWMLIMKME